MYFCNYAGPMVKLNFSMEHFLRFWRFDKIKSCSFSLAMPNNV